MARIRTTKPEFWSDGKVVNLSAYARLLFLGSWNFAICDDGHLPDDAMGLKLKVLPADQVDPVALLGELLAAGVIVRGITADGRSYLHIPRLRDHQKVDGRWTPRCFVCASQKLAETPPTSPELTETRASLDETHRASPELTAVREGKGKEVKNLSDESDADDRFEEFWKHYPRKQAKQDARKAWRQITKSVDVQTVIDGVVTYRFNPDPRYVPLGASWLRGKRWEDEASVHELRPPSANSSTVTGRRQQKLVGPDVWRDITGDEVISYGDKTRWI